MLYQTVSQWHSLHFELFIELVAKKLTELWRFKNLAYFLTWWPSSLTYLFVNVTYWNYSPIPYVDQVWWWYVKAFMSYAWQNWQTNRQTDRQTNRQTNILAKNCKFWQVIKSDFTRSCAQREWSYFMPIETYICSILLQPSPLHPPPLHTHTHTHTIHTHTHTHTPPPPPPPHHPAHKS